MLRSISVHVSFPVGTAAQPSNVEVGFWEFLISEIIGSLCPKEESETSFSYNYVYYVGNQLTISDLTSFQCILFLLFAWQNMVDAYMLYTRKWYF